uniref:Uncharacterized protein n=1 Tax=Arundo donax TaxID=35708 RepID=A0A0A9H1M2_ARUDO
MGPSSKDKSKSSTTKNSYPVTQMLLLRPRRNSKIQAKKNRASNGKSHKV